MSPSSPACRRASRPAPRRCSGVLEKGEQGGALARLADDLPLFSAARRRAEPPPPPESAAEALLRDTRPDELTPREALDLIYRLKALGPMALFQSSRGARGARKLIAYQTRPADHGAVKTLGNLGKHRSIGEAPQ